MNVGERRSLLANVLALGGSQVVSWAVTLLTLLVVANRLGPEAVGQYALALAFWMIGAVVVGFGTATLITLEFARDPDDAPQTLAASLALRLTMFAAVAVVIAVVTLVSGLERTVQILVILVGLGTLAGQVAEALGSALRGVEDMVTGSKVSVVLRTAEAIATITLVIVADIGVVGIGVISVVFATVNVAVLRHVVARTIPVRFTASRPRVVRCARAGAPFLFGFVAIATYREIDVLVMASLLEREVIGWYALADRLMGATLVVPSIVTAAVLPVLARLQSTDSEQADRAFADGFRAMSLLAVPVGIAVVTLGPAAVELLVGSAYAGSGEVLAVLGVVLVFTFHTLLVGNYAMATGRTTAFALIIVVAAALTVPIDLVLVPWSDDRFGNGAIGGALAYVVTESLILVVAVSIFTPFLYSRATAVRIVGAAAAGALMAATIWFSSHLFIAIPLVAGFVAYVAAILVLRLPSPMELDRSRAILSRLRGR